MAGGIRCLPTLHVLLLALAVGAALVTGRRTAVREGPVNIPQVHIIAHTHDDVGWKKTVDEYYYGSNQTVANGAVQYILDSVIIALLENPNRKFSYVEMAFLYRWWREQDESAKEQVRNLLKNGQLEFVGGGWCMNDEGAAHYNAIIDQITLGNAFISTEFGPAYRPRMAWQIDPFGHSSVQAALFAQMGYDGLYFGRADYEDKALRINQSRLELVWRGSPNNLGPKADLFTGMFYNLYASPAEFNFDARSSNPQVVRDDILLEDYNVKTLVNDFVAVIKKQLKGYRTNHIMIPMGGDFTFAAALAHFKNLDKLLKYVNADGRLNVFYSTPSAYLEAIHAQNLTWEMKTDDFFPYADRPHSYMTGFYTSRPALKRYIREQNALLQVCKQMESVHGMTPAGAASFGLREAMAVAQHHDSVSGTEQQHVAYDYAKRLSIGSAQCLALIAHHVSTLLKLPLPGVDATAEGGVFFCTEMNISICSVHSAAPFSVLLYNPLGHARTSKVLVPVMQHSYTVAAETPVTYGVVPVSDAVKHARGNRSDIPNVLVLIAKLPPTTLVAFSIKPSTHLEASHTEEVSISKDRSFQRHPDTDIVTIENEYYSVNVSNGTGRLASIYDKTLGLQLALQQGFYWYESYNVSKNNDQPSGAYIFRPKGSEPYPVSQDALCSITVVKMPGVLEEVRQKCGDFVYQTIALYAGLNHIEFTFTVGPIPVADHRGKEVVSRFSSDLQTAGIFYTDANGREMQRRQRDHRNTWQPNMTIFEHVAGNFYPVNSRIALRDEKKGVQLTILTDSSQAGSSLVDGAAELMVHRRLLVDDLRGLNEPLNETGVSGKGLITRGTHYLQLAPIKSAAAMHRPLAQELLLPALVMFSDNAALEKQAGLVHNRGCDVDAAPTQLPRNVHLLSLQRLDFDPKGNASSQRLVRFEHYFEVGEDTVLSRPALVDVQEYLRSAFGITITSMVEMTLSANQEKLQEKRLHWKVAAQGIGQTPQLDSQRLPMPSWPKKQGMNDFVITLNPMEIRTYVITVQ